MPWENPVVPGPVGPPSTVREYRDAVLSPYSVRRANDADRIRYMTGAVYSDGDLVAASVRSGAHRGDFVRADDPARMAPDAGDGVERLAGRWLYGGHWMGQFGHFITETLTTLWPAERRLDGIVFHRFLSPDVVEQWQLELLRSAGWDLPVSVRTDPCVVDSLVVPSRPLALNQYAGPEAVGVWQSVAAGSAAGAAGRVFLSRSALTDDPRRVVGDAALDDVFRDLGFSVVHPESLPVMEQVDLAASASLVAGTSGSALHLSAFAPGDTRVLELGDRRSPRASIPNQDVIDAACGRERAFVPLVLAGEERDVPATTAAVSDLLGALSTERARS